MKVLVTGGAGFIASHVVDRLVANHHDVTVVDSLEHQVHPHIPTYLNPKAHYYFSRLETCEQLNSILKVTDAVFHFASKVGVAQSQVEIFEFFKANVTSTAALLQNCIGSNVKGIVHSGSMAPYGNAANLPITEKQPFRPLSFYGVTKQTQESMIHLFGEQYGVKTVSLRFFSVYGSRQTLGNPYAGPIPIFIEQLMSKKSPVIFEDGQQTRDFVHVFDAVDACILAMEKEVSGSFNIGTGKATSILKLYRTLCELLNVDIKPIITGRHRAGDIRDSVADISKAKKELDFTPKVSLRNGLQEVISWVKKS